MARTRIDLQNFPSRITLFPGFLPSALELYPRRNLEVRGMARSWIALSENSVGASTGCARRKMVDCTIFLSLESSKFQKHRLFGISFILNASTWL